LGMSAPVLERRFFLVGDLCQITPHGSHLGVSLTAFSHLGEGLAGVHNTFVLVYSFLSVHDNPLRSHHSDRTELNIQGKIVWS
jgi:hypothetical protein